MKFGFIAKPRAIWPIKWFCKATGLSRPVDTLAVPTSKRGRSTVVES